MAIVKDVVMGHGKKSKMWADGSELRRRQGQQDSIGDGFAIRTSTFAGLYDDGHFCSSPIAKSYAAG
jgi:hypothetical protein